MSSMNEHTTRMPATSLSDSDMDATVSGFPIRLSFCTMENGFFTRDVMLSIGFLLVL